jgi:hypothetical protein
MPRRAADDRLRLLHGPYRAPKLHVGDRATCLFRDCDVVVTAWTDAAISWPRGIPVGQRGHPSLVVTEELARAIRTEAAAAVRYWWGLSPGVVTRWRRALEVSKTNNPGSNRLVRAASAKGADAIRGVPLSDEQVEQRRRMAREMNLAQYLQTGYHGPRWTEADLALLGEHPDAEVARSIGRTVNAVRLTRERLGLANPAPFGRPPWTREEDQMVQTLPGVEVARRTGRPLRAVYRRRAALGLPDGRAGNGQARRPGPERR